MNHEMPMMNMMTGIMNDGMNDMDTNGSTGYGGDCNSQFGLEDSGCARNSIKCDDNTPSKYAYHNSAKTYSHAANLLLKTIHFNLEDIKQLAILDSGAISNFLLSDAPMDDERQTLNPIIAKLPDGRQVTSTREGRIRWRQLPEKVRWAHKIPGLAPHSLISVTKLCDAGCTVNFMKIGCQITYRGKVILCGSKCKKSGLWMILPADDTTNEGKMSTIKNLTGDKTERVIPTQSVENIGVNSTPSVENVRFIPTYRKLQQANAVQQENSTSRYLRLLRNVNETMRATIATTGGANTIEEIKEIAASLQVAPVFIGNMQQLRDSMSKPELALFYHQCLGSLAITTLLKAIKNNQLESFPGLTYELISRHLPQTTADVKGRMTRICKGVQSTRNQMQEIREARDKVEDMNPTEEVCAVRDVYCYAILADLNTGIMYSDQTGTFPVGSYSNMQLIFVAYIFDINAIIGLPLKTRTSESIIGAFQKVVKMTEKSNCKPVVSVMNNECSKAVQKYVTGKLILNYARLKIELTGRESHWHLESSFH